MAILCKSKKEGGSARASPVAAPMPKSVSFQEKRKAALGGRIICVCFLVCVQVCVPFTVGVTMYL